MLIRSNADALADRRRVIAAPALQPLLVDDDGVPIPWPPVLNVDPVEVASFNAEWERITAQPFALTLVQEAPDAGFYRRR